MAAIPAHPASHIRLGPIYEKAGIVILGLGHLPHVKGFRHHQKSQFVRQFHDLRRRHIVGSTQGVDAHAAEF